MPDTLLGRLLFAIGRTTSPGFVQAHSDSTVFDASQDGDPFIVET
jgi:hypothetical protein